MSDELEIWGLLYAAEEAVSLLHTVDLGSYLYDFVFGDNFELRTSCMANTDINDNSLRK
jgi:hypothetical protein